MANDTATKELTYPCEAATWDKLDDMLQMTYATLDKDMDDLSRFIHEVPSNNVRWEKLRHLRIVGDDYERPLENFEAIGISRGFHLNTDGSWMLLILPEKPHLGEYLQRCGKYLESLAFRNTQMYYRDWEKLPNLKELYLEDNWFIDSLEDLHHLTKLERLLIHNCPSLTQITGLGKLGHLKYLYIYGCRDLSALPGLESLTQLETLEVHLCDSITALPELGDLTQLTSLNLFWNEQLRQLPPLDNLSQLTSLNLSNCNSLTELPPLHNLSQLTSLDLSGCYSLKQLPPLVNLTQLTSLNLSWCHSITQLPTLDCLTQLTSLDLSGCRSLTQLPKLDCLTQLTCLDLSGCPWLRELPDELRTMNNLRKLDLKFLSLRDLPDWLPEIAESFIMDTTYEAGTSKAAISLFGSSIEEIKDISIFAQPYEMVVDFFEKRKQGKVRTLNEIKVVFLGDGEAGKSHTIARLMNDGGEPDHLIFDGQSTPGIVIRNKEYTVGDRTFTVHYWDFGGQEIMHSMHRIFLTGRTMYVILLNARDDTQGDRAKYWLHNVKSFAPDAPVLLVLNKIDQNENASVDMRDLRGRHDKLTELVRLSARDFNTKDFTDRFTKVLLEQIEKTGFLDAQWPISWTRVKEKLENMTSHYITGDDYQDICAECEVDRNQKELLHWFNDLGVSFCYDDDEEDYALEDYVILRPDWITNALYIILFNRLEGAQNGLIPHKSIYQLLKNAHKDPAIRCTLRNAKYNSGDIHYVLGIMRKFNLSFPDGADHEFIPMLCQQNSTVDVQYYRKDAEVLEFNMEFDYLPNNLLHRLMVERHTELDMANVWRTGARFQFKELGYSAVVVIDGNILRFFIRHSDPMHRPNTYLTMLKTHVDRIVEKMGLNAPKNQLIYKLDGERDEFDLDNLKLRMNIGQTHELSVSHRKMIPIADILNQSAPDGLEDERKLLEAILRSCRRIQDEPMYRLIRNEDGNGYANGKGMEDLRNRRVRDDLGMSGYRVSDQSQRGSSRTGRSVGELDMLIYRESNEPWTIIEALRVSDGAKSDWNVHLDKLVGNYNSRGLPLLYLLTYVDADPTTFDQIWTGYQTHIQKQNPGAFTYSENSFIDLNDPNDPQYVKAAKCRYRSGGNSLTVYHIFARIPTQDE